MAFKFTTDQQYTLYIHFSFLKDNYFQHPNKKSEAVRCWLTRLHCCYGKHMCFRDWEKIRKYKVAFQVSLQKKWIDRNDLWWSFPGDHSDTTAAKESPLLPWRSLTRGSLKAGILTTLECECQMLLKGSLVMRWKNGLHKATLNLSFLSNMSKSLYIYIYIYLWLSLGRITPPH